MELSVFSKPSSSRLTMSSREIAELLGKQHANIKISAERLADKGVIGTLAAQEFTHNGNTYTEYRLNKRDSVILVAQNCPEFTAAIVDRWQELEAQTSGKAPAIESDRERLQGTAEWMTRMLNLHGTEKAAVVKHALQLTAPEMLPLLPAYATNAPRTQDGKLLGGEGNSRPAYAASALLKKVGSGLSIHKFNALVEAAGILETVERPSTKHVGVQRTFKRILERGLKYGYNLSNEHSKGNVQPVWFSDSFEELLDSFNHGK